jgi:hypothetical protein
MGKRGDMMLLIVAILLFLGAIIFGFMLGGDDDG